MHFPFLCFLTKAQEEITFLFFCCCCCFSSVLGMEHRALHMISKFSTTEPRPQPFSRAQGPKQVLYLRVTPSCLSPGTLEKLCSAKPHPSPSRSDSSKLSYSPLWYTLFQPTVWLPNRFTHCCSKHYPSIQSSLSPSTLPQLTVLYPHSSIIKVTSRLDHSPVTSQVPLSLGR